MDMVVPLLQWLSYSGKIDNGKVNTKKRIKKMWDASRCDLCGDCLTNCQYVDYDKDKAVAEIRRLMDGEKAEILSRCIICMACVEYCPTGADPFDLIIKVQEKTGDSPLYMDESSLLALPFLKSPSSLISGDPDKPVLSISISEPPEGAISGQLFEGVSVAKGPKYFSNFGMIHNCRESLVRKYAQRFIDSMSSLGKDIVIFQDDDYTMIDKKVKEYGIDVPFKYMHLFEYLTNYLGNHQDRVIKLGKKVACQRPCPSRYTPEKYSLIDDIFELIGVERLERKYDGVNALCCLFVSANMFDGFQNLASEYQGRNLHDAIECGSDALITICPGCHRTLSGPASSLGLSTIFITDLCRSALGEKQWPA